MFASHTSELGRHPTDGNDSFVATVMRTIATIKGGVYTDEQDTTFHAEPVVPAEMCRRTVAECDVYLGIIGYRHGSVVADDPDERSLWSWSLAKPGASASRICCSCGRQRRRRLRSSRNPAVQGSLRSDNGYGESRNWSSHRSPRPPSSLTQSNVRTTAVHAPRPLAHEQGLVQRQRPNDWDSVIIGIDQGLAVCHHRIVDGVPVTPHRIGDLGHRSGVAADLFTHPPTGSGGEPVTSRGDLWMLKRSGPDTAAEPWAPPPSPDDSQDGGAMGGLRFSTVRWSFVALILPVWIALIAAG
ncbi:MAG: DUF4062 domain-containing protein [Actinomycetota bacterium]